MNALLEVALRRSVVCVGASLVARKKLAGLL
jgi:hypothetical protein